LYSYSFAQNPKWTSFFPSGSEIVRYLYDVCEKYGLLDKIQLDTGVTGIKWIEEDEEWEVTLEHMAAGAGEMTSKERAKLAVEKGSQAVCVKTEIVRAKVVCSAVGGLIEPKENPKIPGLDTFEGSILHTARWDKSVDLHGKDVVLLGTGCSAAQVLPQLIKPEHGVKSVTQLLRSPPWAVPGPPEAALEWWKKWMPTLCTLIPGYQIAVRKFLFTMLEIEFVTLFSPTEKARENRKAKRQELVDHLNSLVPEQYREILTPDYEVFCKRRVIDVDWYKSLQRDNVEITSMPMTAVGRNSVTLGPGRQYPPMSKTESSAPTEQKTIAADIIIMANGYETGEWLHPLDVTGRNGQSMYDLWEQRGGAQAYMGTAMDGFPNFFLIFGPNTATGHSSVILASENMVNYSLNFIKPIMNGEVRTYEVKEEAERKWTTDIQSQLKNSVFQSGGCKSWYYKADSGWNSTVYPRTQIDYTIRCMFPQYSHWTATYTKKGLLMYYFRLTLKLFAALSTVYGLIYMYKNGRKASRDQIVRLVGKLRGYVQNALDALRSRV
jgi:cation diffusion facilitator CzcD-associated flavoprotein CzcO